MPILRGPRLVSTPSPTTMGKLRLTMQGAIRMPSGLIERCAHCGASTRFAKVEYQFRSD